MKNKKVLEVWEEELKPALMWYFLNNMIPEVGEDMTMDEFIKKFNEKKTENQRRCRK